MNGGMPVPAPMEYHVFSILLRNFASEGFDEFPDYLRHPLSMETIINTDSRLGQYDSLRGKFAGRFHCSGRICRMAGAPYRADTGDRRILGCGMVRL